MKTVSFAVAVLLGLASADVPEPKQAAAVKMIGEPGKAKVGTIPEPKVITNKISAKEKMNMSKIKGMVSVEEEPAQMYYVYTGTDSTWYSSTLRSDGNGYTSYDYTYRNSYSYDYTNGDVHKWDYTYWSWNNTHSTYSYGYNPNRSTWYSSYLQSDGYGYTSYDYMYANSYSYVATYGNVVQWDYAKGGWNSTTLLASDASAEVSDVLEDSTQLSTWYSTYLRSDGYGTHTSYDYKYGNSYSYNTSYGKVSKWDYSTWDWNTTASTVKTYNPNASTWYSTYLQSDGYGTRTSYDYSYFNSYSYDSSTGNVHKWDYYYDAWNSSSRTMYNPGASSWYSSTLRSDGYGYKSYDYTYRNSYSYNTNYGEVVKWDYRTNDWNVTHSSTLASKEPIPQTMLKKTVTLAYVAEKKDSDVINMAHDLFSQFEPVHGESQSNIMLAGLTLACLTVLTVAVNKCKKSKDGYEAAGSSSAMVEVEI